MHQENTPSLYFLGNRALQLSGSTKIKTLAYLPKAGLKRAYISGKPYTGSKLILGKKKIASSDRLFQSIDQFNDFKVLKDQLIPTDGKHEIYSEGKSYTRSFSDSTLILEVFADQLPIENSFSGPIILYSKDSIHIGSSSQIEDALIIAPSIHIASDFSGAVQLFAEDRIIIDENAKLDYPSSIVLAARSDSSRLILEEGTHIQGVCIANSKTQKRLLYPQVILKILLYLCVLYGLPCISIVQPPSPLRVTRRGEYLLVFFNISFISTSRIKTITSVVF